jgi:hypothetical protein
MGSEHVRIDPSPVVPLSFCLHAAVVNFTVAFLCRKKSFRQGLEVLKRDLFFAPCVREDGIGLDPHVGQKLADFSGVHVEQSHDYGGLGLDETEASLEDANMGIIRATARVF